MAYFKDVPMFTYPVFTEFSGVSDFVDMMLALRADNDENIVDKYGYTKMQVNMFNEMYESEIAFLIDMVEASEFDLASGLRVLYLEQWSEAKCYPEFAMLPRAIRCAVAKGSSVHDAAEKFEIKDFEEFDLAFLKWAEKAKCDMDTVDYQDFIAASYLALQTQ